MKQILLYLIIGIFLMTSCSEDFLEINRETAVSSGAFYKTADDFEQALNAANEKMRAIALNGIYMDEMRADNSFYTMYSGDRGPYLTTEVIALFLDDETTGNWVANRYNDVYSGIARANTIIDRVDASEMNDSQKKAVRAEALFLRAFYYFDLVTHWGPVPLMLKEVKSETEAMQPNATIEAIYAQIITDAGEAIQLGLPVAASFPQSGRATLGAAKMLRAYAYMSKPVREYALAEQDLKDITKMNYSLESNYADVFDLKNKNGKESIFEVQFLDGDGGQHSDFPWRLIPKCSNNDTLMGINANNYAYTSGGWNVPTKEMIESYEAGDKRLSASIAVAEGRENESEQFWVNEIKDIDGYTPTPGKAYRIFVRKYYHPKYNYSLKAGNNFPVYRYAGALLLLSECLVEQGKADEALPYLNSVRTRAGLAPLATANKQNVSDEMRHELAFENHRWTDLIRTGQVIDVMNRFGKTMKSLYGWIPQNAFEVNQNRLLYPFQKRELEVNKYLTQNPGYKDY